MHRAGDSGWIEFSVDGRATGAETTRTVSCVPGGAWPGRSAVQLAAGKCTRLLQSEGQAVGLSQSEDRRERPTARARWTLRWSCSTGEGRARADSQGHGEEGHGGVRRR